MPRVVGAPGKRWLVRASCPNWTLAGASTERAVLCPPARPIAQGLGDSLVDSPLPVQQLLLGTVWNGRFQNQVWGRISCFGRAETLKDPLILPSGKTLAGRGLLGWWVTIWAGIGG